MKKNPASLLDLNSEAKPLPESTCRRRGRLFFFILTLMLLILNLVAPGPFLKEPITLTERVIASLIFVFALLPTYFYVKGKRTEEFPFVPIWGWIYAWYYASGIFLLGRRAQYLSTARVPHSSVEYALFVALVALIVILFAYYKLPGRSITRFLPKVRLRWDYKKAKFWGFLLGFAGLGCYYIQLVAEIPTYLAQVVRFSADLCTISIGILLILYLCGGLVRVDKVSFSLIVIARFFLGLSTGQAASIVLLLGFILLVYFAVKRSIPWLGIILILILFFIFQGIKADVREKIWVWGVSAKEHKLKDAAVTVSSAKDFITEAETGAPSDIWTYEFLANFRTNNLFLLKYLKASYTILGRINGLKILSVVVTMTPEEIPFWRGKTLYSLFFTPIPRIIWPGKPKGGSAWFNGFGREYCLIAESDYTTSVRISRLTDLYGNFGMPGVIIGMFLIGAFYRVIQEMFMDKKSGYGALLVGIYIFWRCLDIETNVSGLFGGLFYTIIFLILINKVLLCK